MDDHPAAAAPTPPVTPVKIEHAHKFIFGYIAVLILVIGMSGMYAWQHAKVNSLNTEVQTLNGKMSALTGQNKATQAVGKNFASGVSSANPRSFYDCLDAGGTTSKTLPLTCAVFGQTYSFPGAFNVFQVDNLARVPSGALSLVTSIGQTNFQQCSGNLLQTVPTMSVTLAQSDFVDVGVGCDSGHHEYLGLSGSKWVDLGGGQSGISCAMVSQYKIKQSSLVSIDGSAGDTACANSDGTSGTVPVN